MLDLVSKVPPFAQGLLLGVEQVGFSSLISQNRGFPNPIAITKETICIDAKALLRIVGKLDDVISGGPRFIPQEIQAVGGSPEDAHAGEVIVC